MFLDALGRAATPDELKDIQLNVWMLEHAGFAVEDTSNAPFIAPWAWMWARDLRERNSRTESETRAIVERTEQRIIAVESTLREFLAKLDPGAFALSIAKAMPPLVLEHQIDSGFLASTLRDSLSLLWVWLAALCIGCSGYLGWTLGAQYERGRLEARVAEESQQLAREEQIIDRLMTTPSKR